MTHDELQNNSSDTGTIFPTYRCAFCQGKIVSCNCDRGFKNAIETSLRKQITEELTAWRALKEKRMGSKWEGLQSLDDAIYLVNKAIDKEWG